jgi:hypothetical protein
MCTTSGGEGIGTALLELDELPIANGRREMRPYEVV